MKPVKTNCKGVETAPLFIVFSAIIVVILAGFMFDEMSKWGRVNDWMKTQKEAKRVAETVDEMMLLGDTGSAQTIHVDVPAGCCIRFELEGVISYCNIPGDDTVRREVVSSFTKSWNIDSPLDNNEICGQSVDLVVAHWSESGSAPKGSYIVYVR